MKKILLCAAFAVLGIKSMNAQDANFGVKAGVDFASATAKGNGVSVTGSETGFYIGAFAEVEVSDSFEFRPEILYVSITDSNQIAIPLMAQFGVSEELSLLAGPALGILLDTVDGQKSFNFGIEAGAAYDITEDIFVEARYNLGLANLIEDAPSGVSARISGLFVGLGYRF